MSINDALRAAMARIEAAEAAKAAAPAEAPADDSSAAPEDRVVAETPTDDEGTADTWTSVSEAAQPTVERAEEDHQPAVRQALSIKGLDEKAVLVSVKRRMYSPYKLDEAESVAYGAGNVNKHLFQGRDNRVKDTISKFTEVYTYVNDNTVPWTTGVRMLNIEHYVDFTTGLRQRISAAEAAVADLEAHWDTEVQADLARLQTIAAAKSKPTLANPSDYPTASEIADRFGIEVRYMPVPTSGDFRVGISDEDKASLEKQLDDAEQYAAKHVIEQMLEPMQRAAGKLAVPVGEDGSIFRDSLIDNMVEVADRMARVNVSNDPTVASKIEDLRSLVGAYANNKDVLRNNQSVRQKAATQISDLMNQMGGLV